MQSDFAEEDENGKKPNSLSINLRELIRPDFENFLNENSQNDTSLIQPEEIFLPPKELAVEEPNEKYEIQPVEPEPVMP